MKQHLLLYTCSRLGRYFMVAVKDILAAACECEPPLMFCDTTHAQNDQLQNCRPPGHESAPDMLKTGQFRWQAGRSVNSVYFAPTANVELMNSQDIFNTNPYLACGMDSVSQKPKCSVAVGWLRALFLVGIPDSGVYVIALHFFSSSVSDVVLSDTVCMFVYCSITVAVVSPHSQTLLVQTFYTLHQKPLLDHSPVVQIKTNAGTGSCQYEGF